jgi:hypothetical protein
MAIEGVTGLFSRRAARLDPADAAAAGPSGARAGGGGRVSFFWGCANDDTAA